MEHAKSSEIIEKAIGKNSPRRLPRQREHMQPGLNIPVFHIQYQNIASGALLTRPQMPRTRTSTYSHRYRDLLEMLRAVREEREVVQKQLAKKMGMSQSMLSKLENGVTRIDLPELLSYLAALDADPVDFLRAYLKRIGRKKA